VITDSAFLQSLAASTIRTLPLSLWTQATISPLES
jgi:hypothetical protein